MKKFDLIPVDELKEAAECVKVMAHPVRLRIVDILIHGDAPVHRIAELCELAHHQVCEHLRLLKGRGLLQSRRAGREVFYSISCERLPRLLQCLINNCSRK
jgi:ArsR family transcriptional regulator, zinc-responsive transcriptional repressor